MHIEVASINNIINVLGTNSYFESLLSIGLFPTTVVDEDIMVPAITSGISNIT